MQKNFLQNALAQRLEEMAQESTDTSNKSSGKGIDALIRKTRKGEKIEVDLPAAQKRITFVMKKAYIQKLKSIARSENQYLKDVIGEIVSEFIRDYEQEHGELILKSE